VTQDLPPQSEGAASAPDSWSELSAYTDSVRLLNVGICVWELEEENVPSSLRLLVCNPAAARFMNVKQEEVIGKRIHDGFPGSEEMPLAGIFTKVAMSGESMALGDVPYIDQIVPESVFSIVVHAQAKRRACVEFTNVTERTKAEKKVAEQTAELQRALAELWSEMDLARKIQTVLVPSEPKAPGFEIAAEMRPAATVGGDYFDVFEMGGATWFLIGDVSGHGVTAGLIMMMAQTAVRTTVETLSRHGETPTPARVLALVNGAIRANIEKIGKDQYMTVTALCVRDGVVQHAGLHQDILVYRAATGTIEAIETNGIWLGVVDDAAPLLADETFELHDGDAMLLYSDGIVEGRLAGTHETFGPDRLQAVFLDGMKTGTAPSGLVATLLEESGKLDITDDVTVLVARKTAVTK
jgi:serine phosphatase RsbU (regulator of sigma subunit)